MVNTGTLQSLQIDTGGILASKRVLQIDSIFVAIQLGFILDRVYTGSTV